MTLASVGFVSERRKTYGDDAAIKQVTQFLIDFLAELMSHHLSAGPQTYWRLT